jgi:hypothetical protein
MNILLFIVSGLLSLVLLVLYLTHIEMYFKYRKESGTESIGGYLFFVKFIKLFKQYEWMRSENHWGFIIY